MTFKVTDRQYDRLS